VYVRVGGTVPFQDLLALGRSCTGRTVSCLETCRNNNSNSCCSGSFPVDLFICHGVVLDIPIPYYIQSPLNWAKVRHSRLWRGAVSET
jgi:hypothetical protein